jgi:hypothetical protein
LKAAVGTSKRACPTCASNISEQPGKKFCSDNCRKRHWERESYRTHCVDCNAEISRRSRRCHDCSLTHFEHLRQQKFEALQRLWAKGLPVREIARELGYSASSIGPQIERAKKAGFEFPPRRPGWKGHTKQVGAKRTAPDSHQKVSQRLNYEIRSGRLKRPESCERCGKRGRVDGHHHDYSKPLDVEWLCRPCHTAHHIKERQVAMEQRVAEHEATQPDSPAQEAAA